MNLVQHVKMNHTHHIYAAISIFIHYVVALFACCSRVVCSVMKTANLIQQMTFDWKRFVKKFLIKVFLWFVNHDNGLSLSIELRSSCPAHHLQHICDREVDIPTRSSARNGQVNRTEHTHTHTHTHTVPMLPTSHANTSLVPTPFHFSSFHSH